MASSPHCSDKPQSMDVVTVLRMKEGISESSYAKNSSLQKKGMDTFKSFVTESATRVYESVKPERFTIAELGCASGPNAFGLVEDAIKSITGNICRGALPEFSVLLNDLPTNDFNAIFSCVPEFAAKLKAETKAEVFLSGVPGSFYGRLFLSRSVHLVCSFASLHWLSQVPPGLSDETNTPLNKGKMFISSTSPPAVPKAYLKQFQRDFGLFLQSRAAEIVPGGAMILSTLGRKNRGYTDGLVDQEKVDAYNAPFYAPSPQEIEEEVRREGSFSLDSVQTFETNLSVTGDAQRDGTMLSMGMRAIQEPMLSHQFGPDIMDALFHKLTEL
ncbi:hypothetical protein EJB05_17306, partial [Eragrostis curvula]